MFDLPFRRLSENTHVIEAKGAGFRAQGNEKIFYSLEP